MYIYIYTVGKLLCSVGGRVDLDCCEPKPKSAHEVAWDTQDILHKFTREELSLSGRYA